MMYDVLTKVTEIFQASLLSIFFIAAMDMRINKAAAFVIWAVGMAMYLAWTWLQADPFASTPLFYVIFNLVYLCILSKEKIAYTLTMLVTNYLIIIIVDLIVGFIFCILLKVDLEAILFDAKTGTEVNLVNAGIYLFICGNVVRIIRKIKKEKGRSVYSIFLFLGFPFCQIFFIVYAYLFNILMGGVSADIYFVPMVVIFVAADVFLYFALRDFRRKSRIKEQFYFLQGQREVARNHLYEIIAAEENYKKIFHDVKNNLAVAKGLIAAKNYKEAITFSENLRAKIDDPEISGGNGRD